MNFLYASDDNFSGVLAVSLHTLFSSGNGNGNSVYIVDGGIRAEHKAALTEIARRFSGEIHFMEAPSVFAAGGEEIEVGRYSMSMFSRIFADTLLPQEDRVIYLDCDTLILHDLSELWHTDMHGLPIGAVNDLRSEKYGKALGISVGNTYINSGVLLMDLKAYRRNNCAEHLMKALTVGNGLLEFPDNDIICSVLQDEIYLLPMKYNVISTAFAYAGREMNKYRKPSLPLSEQEHSEAVADPCIVHFTRCFWFNARPWEKGSSHPYAEKFKEIFSEYEKNFAATEKKKDTTLSVTGIIKRLMPRFMVMTLSGVVHADVKPMLSYGRLKTYREYIKAKRKKKIVILRSQAVNADSRAEKEAYSLLSGGYAPVFLGWNRDVSGNIIHRNKVLFGRTVPLFQICVKGKYFQGFVKNLIPMARFQMQMLRWLKKNRQDIDAIHACDLDTALLTARFAKKKHIPFVYDVYDYYPDGHAKKGTGMYKALTRLDRKTEKRSDAVIVCTEERLTQIAPEMCKRVEVIHNALPMLYSQNAESKGVVQHNGLVHFVFIGAIIRGRYLMEMIETIAAKGNVCDMYIGGFGSDGMIEQIKAYESRHDNIHFIGFLPYQDVISIEKECDVIPAVFDPTIGNHRFAAPNKFYEAIMLGKPLIMLHDTGMDKWVSEYGIGKVISGETSDEFRAEFSKAVDELIARRDEWQTIAETERRLYNERFSWEIMESRLLNLYDEMFDNER